MVKKGLQILLFLGMLGVALLFPGRALATAEGYLDCGKDNLEFESGGCIDCHSKAGTCESGCPDNYPCLCSSNCPSNSTPNPSASPTPTAPPSGCASAGTHAPIAPSCEGGTGFYGKTYATLSSSVNPISETYSCAPYASPINGRETCDYWDNEWEGYLDIPEGGEYEFLVTFSPKLTLKMDINGDGSFGSCDNGLASKINTFGDNFIFRSNTCSDTYRYIYLNNWAITANAQGEDCWSGASVCNAGKHCEKADYRTDAVSAEAVSPYLPIIVSPLAAKRQGTTECPISGETIILGGDNENLEWKSKGNGYSWFTRTLSEGRLHIHMRLSTPVGDTASSETLNFKYRKKPSGSYYNSTPVNSSEWIDLSDSTTYPNNVCPVAPMADCPVVSGTAWWQVVDSDVIATNLTNSIPLLYYFDDEGPGGFPGVPIYASSTTLDYSNVSSKGWLANASYNAKKVFNSNYYINMIPTDVSADPLSLVASNSVSVTNLISAGVSYNGYRWIIYDGTSTGDLTISNASGTSLGENKIILVAENANINITGNINGITRGSGFFLAISEGNINIDPSVGGGESANLEGIYIANGVFNSGTAGTGADTQLWVRGSVAGYSGTDLYRDMGSSNSTTPGEKFEYAPDQELLFPIALSYKLINWREVAP